MDVSGVSASSQLKQIQSLMLTSVMGQQESAIASIDSAVQSPDLSFMGIGLNIDLQA